MNEENKKKCLFEVNKNMSEIFWDFHHQNLTLKSASIKKDCDKFFHSYKEFSGILIKFA